MLLDYQFEQKGRSKHCSFRDAGIGQVASSWAILDFLDKNLPCHQMEHLTYDADFFLSRK